MHNNTANLVQKKKLVTQSEASNFIFKKKGLLKIKQFL